MKILYSFNKNGDESKFWSLEIGAASNDSNSFIPFNHGCYLNSLLYQRAQKLDELYFNRDPKLMKLYLAVEELVRDGQIDALIVDNCAPYHPDWLRGLPVYKVLRTTDGPMCAYDRDFAYVHAYDLILYHSPAYSRDLNMSEKLSYVGAKRTAFWPLGVFDSAFEPQMSEDELMRQKRDIDVVFVGALHRGKMPLLAQVKRALGSSCRMHGLATIKQNIWFNARHSFPGWMTSISQFEYAPLYRRAKIGFNVHNRGKFTVGSYRLYELPANGVMQISDGDEYLSSFFEEGHEIVGYSQVDDLIDKIRYYLAHDSERRRIAAAGYNRVMRDYRIEHLLHKLVDLIQEAQS